MLVNSLCGSVLFRDMLHRGLFDACCAVVALGVIQPVALTMEYRSLGFRV